jgi:hypothetical protein
MNGSMHVESITLHTTHALTLSSMQQSCAQTYNSIGVHTLQGKAAD